MRTTFLEPLGPQGTKLNRPAKENASVQPEDTAEPLITAQKERQHSVTTAAAKAVH